jgi:hypothetical protein
LRIPYRSVQVDQLTPAAAGWLVAAQDRSRRRPCPLELTRLLILQTPRVA